MQAKRRIFVTIGELVLGWCERNYPCEFLLRNFAVVAVVEHQLE